MTANQNQPVQALTERNLLSLALVSIAILGWASTAYLSAHPSIVTQQQFITQTQFATRTDTSVSYMTQVSYTTMTQISYTGGYGYGNQYPYYGNSNPQYPCYGTNCYQNPQYPCYGTQCNYQQQGTPVQVSGLVDQNQGSTGCIYLRTFSLSGSQVYGLFHGSYTGPFTGGFHTVKGYTYTNGYYGSGYNYNACTGTPLVVTDFY